MPGNRDANPPAANVAPIQTTGGTLEINNVKLYILVAAL